MPAPMTPDQRYSTVALSFHWVIAALVIVNLAIGLLHESLLKGTMPLHKSIGITVLVLTVARVAWRIAHRPPPLPAEVPALERAVAHAVHWTLYGLLIVMPLTGWVMVSGGPTPRPLAWFGLVAVPHLPVSKATSGIGHDAHELLGWLMLGLVVIHVMAALRHHLILRDGILARMAPALDRR